MTGRDDVSSWRGWRRACPDLVEVLEEGLLDAEVLDHGLDDDVDIGEVVQPGRAGDLGERRGGRPRWPSRAARPSRGSW